MRIDPIAPPNSRRVDGLVSSVAEYVSHHAGSGMEKRMLSNTNGTYGHTSA
ncbi:MAG: hypothetical protein ACO1RT_08650 [Planctomycetaceae bacterium]